MRFAANVGFLYPERPYLDRFRAARDDGFEAVESAWPIVGADAFAVAVRDAGLQVALLNVDAGDLDAGERGRTNDPAAIERWREDLRAALRLAERIDCGVLNVLAGNRLPDVSLAAQLECLRANLEWALGEAASAGSGLVVELLNPTDTPDYLVTSLAEVDAVIAPLAEIGLGLQFDTYHVARIEPDVVAAYRRVAPLVRHVQIADHPGRHQPGTGRIDWSAFFRALDESGYEGAIGLEYRPLGDTTAGLAWLEPRFRRWSAESASLVASTF
jgi:hydroxypyruvate isomerase